MVTTKKRAIEYTHPKNEKVFKPFTTKKMST